METVEKDKVMEQQEIKQDMYAAFKKLMPFYFLSLILSLASLYLYFSSFTSKEFIISASLIAFNFLLVLAFDTQLIKTLKFLFWGVAMKLAKTFLLLVVVMAFAFTGAVTEPKQLVIGYAIGFFVGHAIEIFILTKLPCLCFS